MKQSQATRNAISDLKAEARKSGCNGTGCDLVRWLRAGSVISANCSVCGRIYSTERLSPALRPI